MGRFAFGAARCGRCINWLTCTNGSASSRLAGRQHHRAINTLQDPVANAVRTESFRMCKQLAARRRQDRPCVRKLVWSPALGPHHAHLHRDHAVLLGRPTLLLSATPFRNDYKLFTVRGAYACSLPFQRAAEANIVRDIAFSELRAEAGSPPAIDASARDGDQPLTAQDKAAIAAFAKNLQDISSGQFSFVSHPRTSGSQTGTCAT
jgi:hypothetical protein